MEKAHPKEYKKSTTVPLKNRGEGRNKSLSARGKMIEKEIRKQGKNKINNPRPPVQKLRSFLEHQISAVIKNTAHRR